jgi:hypothetical protein
MNVKNVFFAIFIVLTISNDFWNFTVAFRLISYFRIFPSIFEAFYQSSVTFRHILGHYFGAYFYSKTLIAVKYVLKSMELLTKGYGKSDLLENRI